MRHYNYNWVESESLLFHAPSSVLAFITLLTHVSLLTAILWNYSMYCESVIIFWGFLLSPMVKNNADLLDFLVIWRIFFKSFFFKFYCHRFVVHGSSNTTFPKLFPLWLPQPRCLVILEDSFLSFFLHNIF